MKKRKKLKAPRLEQRKVPEVAPGQNPITERQQHMLDLLVMRYRADYRPASVRELMQDAGINSPNGVICHMKALQKKGFVLELDDKSSRRFVPMTVVAHLDQMQI